MSVWWSEKVVVVGGLVEMTMWTLMTRRKIQSASLCCAIIILIWLQQLVTQRGEIGENQRLDSPYRVKVKCSSCRVCVLSICDYSVSVPQAPAESLNLILCDPVIDF